MQEHLGVVQSQGKKERSMDTARKFRVRTHFASANTSMRANARASPP